MNSIFTWKLTITTERKSGGRPEAVTLDATSEEDGGRQYTEFLKKVPSDRKIVYANLASPITSGMLGKKDEKMVRLDLEK